jgi:hypothetical protein
VGQTIKAEPTDWSQDRKGGTGAEERREAIAEARRRRRNKRYSIYNIKLKSTSLTLILFYLISNKRQTSSDGE